jgi:uncharacterized protein
MRGDLTVADAALALGTSPQTVRTMLRKGQLQGAMRPWGSRYVWDVSAEGVDQFLAEYGRLDGHRRPPRREPAPVGDVAIRADDSPGDGDLELLEVPERPDPSAWSEQLSQPDPVADRRPFVLRPRGRSTVIVIVLGLPLLIAHLAAKTLPPALWFNELGQRDVFGRIVVAEFQFRFLVIVTVALFMAANLTIACRGVPRGYRRAGRIAAVIVSLVVGGMFASAVAGRWQTFLLWRHRQTFGVHESVHGKDVGFFVFTLPFELLVAQLLLWLVAATALSVALVYAGCGRLSWRGRQAAFDAQQHLAVLAALFLLSVGWRVHLQQYLLELQQPSARDPDSFAGADYVDVHVRTPALDVLCLMLVLVALACVAAPHVARRRGRRTCRHLLAVPVVGLVVSAGLGLLLAPALVQRYVVDPSPLLREQALLERSIAATRNGLGLDTAGVQSYVQTHSFDAADFSRITTRLRHVQIWDNDLLGARMRQLVTDTPYFRPEDQTLDIVRVDGRRQPAVVSARELDLDAVQRAGTWTSDRLAYTHGLGLIRYSGIDTGEDRGPRLLDSGLGVRQPHIYFGDLAGSSSPGPGDPAPPTGASPSPFRSVVDAAWVLVNTRRSEVDAATAASSPARPYHYPGSGGIALSSWYRRAAFALALGSKQLLLSHDITPDSRILLHRDVHDRLHTLAPFIHWDANAIPMTLGDRVVFAVDGYTTSPNYPDAEWVDLGGTSVNYARPSVRATVDAFSGRVHLYVTDPDDPLVRAWAAAFPTLFDPADTMPHQLREQLRYPSELFTAQATAYERFHTTDPNVFSSESDVWSRPVALSGPIEVASGVDFDQSDEDDLRLTMQPSYTFSSPPGGEAPRLTLSTYYVPRQGQNLVATLTGWIDGQGRPRLTTVSLPRDPVTLGPAQVSRLVFATPRVSNLLGLRNLEIRDLNTSSLDSVILGRPHLLFLPGGVMQIQSLYEGSRGPGAARLLGVTAYINGRAGLGPDIDSAVRQALNEPPAVEVEPRHVPATVGQHLTIGFRVQNARRETVTITSPDGRTRMKRRFGTGRGSVSWTPTVAGRTRVRVAVLGLDGTEVTDSTVIRVLGRPPTLRLLGGPGRAEVGTAVRIPFRVRHGHRALVTVSTRAGIVFARRYDLPDGKGVVHWTPESPGRATILVRARGRQRQTATVTLRLRVHRTQSTPAPPPIELLQVPGHPTVGMPGAYALRASECRVAVVRIEGPGPDVPAWRFPCPVRRARFTWTPSVPGQYELTTIAHATGGLLTSQTLQITVEPSPEATPSASPSTTANATVSP